MHKSYFHYYRSIIKNVHYFLFLHKWHNVTVWKKEYWKVKEILYLRK